MAYFVIDHDRASGLLVKALLEQVNIDVITDPGIRIARSGREVSESLSSFAEPGMPLPDLMILDADFQDVPAITLCRNIRADSRYENVPLIVTCGNSDMKIMRGFFSAGADDFIFKPLNRTEFHARTRMAIMAFRYERIQKSRQEELEEMNRQLEEKNMTIREQQAKIIYQGKLGALSRVAAGIAHEINNPLSYVYGNVDYIKTWLEELSALIGDLRTLLADHPGQLRRLERISLPDLVSAIDSAVEGSMRIREIIRHFKDLSYYDEKHMGDLFLPDLLAECAATLRSQNPTVKIHEDIRNVPVFFGNRKVFYNAVWNIMVNAYEAIAEAVHEGILFPDDGRIHLNTDLQTLSGDDWVVIAVRDNGIGIPQEQQEMLFEPFFTTKKRLKNYGLGLYEVYNILQPYNGTVQIRSVHHEGTEVTVKIPLKENRLSPPAS